jgi:hypothetical protein
MAFQLALSIAKVSKLSHQARAGPRRMLESSQTLQRSSQKAILAVASTQSISLHTVVVSVAASLWKGGRLMDRFKQLWAVKVAWKVTGLRFCVSLSAMLRG